jgi:hypothetical protein
MSSLVLNQIGLALILDQRFINAAAESCAVEEVVRVNTSRARACVETGWRRARLTGR